MLQYSSILLNLVLKSLIGRARSAADCRARAAGQPGHQDTMVAQRERRDVRRARHRAKLHGQNDRSTNYDNPRPRELIVLSISGFHLNTRGLDEPPFLPPTLVPPSVQRATNIASCLCGDVYSMVVRLVPCKSEPGPRRRKVRPRQEPVEVPAPNLGAVRLAVAHLGFGRLAASEYNIESRRFS